MSLKTESNSPRMEYFSECFNMLFGNYINCFDTIFYFQLN